MELNYFCKEILVDILEKSTFDKVYYLTKHQFYQLSNILLVCKKWTTYKDEISKLIMSFKHKNQVRQNIGILHKSNANLIIHAKNYGLKLPKIMFYSPDHYFKNYARILFVCNLFKVCPKSLIRNFEDDKNKPTNNYYAYMNWCTPKYSTTSIVLACVQRYEDLPEFCNCNICLNNKVC